MKQRTLLVTLATLVVALWVIGCANATPAPTAAPTNPPAPTGAPPPTTAPTSASVATTAPTAAPSAELSGEITFYINEGADEVGGFQDLVSTFLKMHPKAKITLVNIPNDDEFDAKIAALYSARTPPDLININFRRFGQFAIKGVLQPLDDYIAGSQVIKLGDYYPQSLEAFQFKGHQYCIPQNLSSLEVYYNRTLFEKANVPLPKAGWTWADFLNDAKALTKDTNGDSKTDQYGLGVDPTTIRLVAFIWEHGGEIVDDVNKPTKLTIDSPAALEAFQWFVDLQNKYHVVPNKADEATQADIDRFTSGTMGMYLNSRVETPGLRETIQDNFEWDVAPMPTDKTTATVLHSDGYCISSSGKNKDLAWAFTEFANGPVGEKQLVATGRTVPSIKSIAESDDFLKQSEPPPSSKIYLDMIPNIRRLPIATTWLEVEHVLDNEIQRAFYGDATVKEAADAAVKGTAEFFQQNLKDLSAQ